MSKGWHIERLAAALGAEVRGADLARATKDDLEEIYQLLLEHKVLFFPEQDISLEEHVALGKHYGNVECHSNIRNVKTDCPEVFELVASAGGIADEWHSDVTFQSSPSIMSILRMVKCPPVGGDTMWTSLEAAYEGLSSPMQWMCESITALHDAAPHFRPDKMAIHPVVRVHPDTNRKSLYVNEHFTRRLVELSTEESAALLDFLVGWVQRPRFTMRYRWSEGTMAIWDNRCTQHFVVSDFHEERIIQRVTVMGDRVTGAREPRWPPYLRPGPLSATSRYDRQLRSKINLQDAKHRPRPSAKATKKPRENHPR